MMHIELDSNFVGDSGDVFSYEQTNSINGVLSNFDGVGLFLAGVNFCHVFSCPQNVKLSQIETRLSPSINHISCSD